MTTTGVLFSFVNFNQLNQYTGFEHTRIAEMMSVLAILSVVMWTAVCLSIVARYSARLIIKRVHRNKPIEENIQAE